MFKLRNDHRVFVLGAGFSAARGLPLMSNFSMRMRDAARWCESNNRLSEFNAINDVLNFRLDAASAAYRVNVDLENIEELFSLASASNPSIADSVRVSIAATLNFCERTTPPWMVNASGQSEYSQNYVRFGLLPAGHGDPRQIDFYASMVANLIGAGEIGSRSFISFNYDLLLEQALKKLNVPYDYGFAPGEAASPLGDAPQSTGVFKLHGSTNWVTNEQGVLEVFPDYETVHQMRLIPDLVPPTWNKTIASKLGEVWKSAIEVLTTATEIVVIGFSMPPTDLHFKYLLAAGMQNNISLRRIRFIAPDPQIRGRVERLFTQNELGSGRIEFENQRIEGMFFQLYANHIASPIVEPRSIFS